MKLSASKYFLICIIFICVVVCAMPLMWLSSSFVIDDALYYPRLAQNIVAGHGVTFDRHTYTNGFHPLWEMMLLVPALIARGDHLLMLRLSFVSCGALIITAVTLLHGLSRRLQWSSAGVIVALMLLYFPRFDLWMSIMEAAPTMCILLLMLYLSHRHQLLVSEKISNNLLFGVLMAMVFLVRLDQVFIVIVMFIGCVYMRLYIGQSLQKLLTGVVISGLTATLLVLPYLLANLYYFGHFVPVSGLKKHVIASSVADVLRTACQPFMVISDKVNLPMWVLILLAFGFLGVGIYSSWLARRHGEKSPKIFTGGVISFFALGVFARWTYLRIFVSFESATVPWYWVPEYVLFCIMSGYFIACMAFLLPERLTLLRGWRLGCSAMIIILVALGTIYIRLDAARANTIPEEHALWAKANLSSDKLYAMYDPGVFSYITQFDTIPLNGLIADKQTMLDSYDLAYNKIMERFDVDYLVVYLSDDRFAKIPPNALIHKQQALYDDWLCIIDRRIYSPFDK